uniref:IQ motif containing K n=1 Tax=Calidris pygmaea TaxID=425635 RepID=A0A8C3PSB0_9CHAR
MGAPRHRPSPPGSTGLRRSAPTRAPPLTCRRPRAAPAAPRRPGRGTRPAPAPRRGLAERLPRQRGAADMAAGGLWERVCAGGSRSPRPFPGGGCGCGCVCVGVRSWLGLNALLFCPGSPREYLEYYIFPVLLPGMAELLHRAKKEKCFERKRTKFIACDFLTEWLYNNNPKRKDESFTEFFSIPFVNDWLKDHPRPPIPLSLLLSEEEASIIIQSFWRGYRVRCDREIQELRQWQKKLREDKNIFKSVREFWSKQEAKGRLIKLIIHSEEQNHTSQQGKTAFICVYIYRVFVCSE